MPYNDTICKFTDLSENVISTSKEIGSAIKQISEAAEMIAQGATEQALDSEKCSKLVCDFTYKIDSVIDMSIQMNERIMEIQGISSDGKDTMEKLLEKNSDSQKTITEIAAGMGRLEDKMKNIGKITNAIISIATQTNLLSLNAAIEAARAGEAGKGFGVVAQEIKKLADQSFMSSKEITNILKGIKDEIDRSIKTIEKSLLAISGETAAVKEANDSFKEIDTTIYQSIEFFEILNSEIEGLKNSQVKITASVTDIAAVAEQTAAATQQMASLTAQQMNSVCLFENISEDLNRAMASIDLEAFRDDENRCPAKKYVLIASQPESHLYFKQMIKSAQKTAQKLKAELIVEAPLTTVDAIHGEKFQAEAVKKYSESSIEGIIICPFSGDMIQREVENAVKRGINVVYISSDLPKSGRKCYIGQNNFKAGEEIAKTASKLLEKKGKIIFTSSFWGKSAQYNMDVYEGFKKWISANTDINIVLEVSETDLAARGARLKAVINRNRDFFLMVELGYQHINLIENIWKELNLKQKLVVYEINKEAVEALKEGIITAIIAKRNDIYAEIAISRLYEIRLGKKVEEFIDTGVYEINRTNLNVFNLP